MRRRCLQRIQGSGGTTVLLLLLALSARSVPAMEVGQMRGFAGLDMLEQRAQQVVATYGEPTALQVGGAGGGESDWATGDWVLFYTPPVGDERPSQQAPTVERQFSAFSRLIVHAKGGVGQVTVRRKPQKTTYDISGDPYQSHQVVSVDADWRRPQSLRALVAACGDYDAALEDKNGTHWVRYWVLRKQGQVPLRLYAVDFRLADDGAAVTGFRANGPQIEFVARELQARHKVWELNMYD